MCVQHWPLESPVGKEQWLSEVCSSDLAFSVIHIRNAVEATADISRDTGPVTSLPL